MTAQELIQLLKLVPLEGEGGMYRPTYESEETIGGAPAGTAIYYLLTGNSFSHLHRLRADEIYHHYLGDPVDLYSIDHSGALTHTVLGSDIEAGQLPQAIVKKNAWQGSRLVHGGKWALLGTTMSPGYTAGSYEHADAEKLICEFPGLEDVIRRLTGSICFF